MKTIIATFSIVTPMFLGGSDPASPQGLRPSSIKGALRFWWRALNWCRHAGSHEIDGLKSLHRQESDLFGHSASDNGGGQGIFLLQVIDRSKPVSKQPFGGEFGNGILYLLGQGLGSFKGGNHCTRDALPAGEFELRLIFHPRAKLADITSVVQAVQAFGLLGSLGSRARHGMGSVALTSLRQDGLGLPEWKAPATPDEYHAALQGLLAEARRAPGLPPLSAFSAGSRIDLWQQEATPTRKGNDNALALLEQLGREQQAHRSYGKDGKVNGQPSERRFVADHDLIRTAADGRTIDRAPQRVVFGLPHNYFFSSDNAKVDVNYRPDGADARRASPLLLHIHPVGPGHVAVHTLLKSRFLPDGARVQLKPGKSRGTDVPVSVDWQVLHGYLDRFKKMPAWRTL